METYTFASNGVIIRGSDGAYIPLDPYNMDYQAYSAWVDEGGVTAPYVPPTPPKPTSVTLAQAKVAMFRAGILDAVEAAVAASTYKPVQIYWSSASSFERNNPYVLGLAAELNISDEQMDALFDEASKITQ